MSDYRVSEYSNLIDIMLICGFSIISITKWTRIEKFFFDKTKIIFKLFILLLLILIISYIRSNTINVTFSYYLLKITMLISMILASISIISIVTDKKKQQNSKYEVLFFYIILIPVIHLTVNYLLEIFSIDIFNFKDSFPQIGRSEILYYLFGIEIPRLPFPLTFGVNNYGSFLGASAVMSITLFTITKVRKLKIIALFFFLIVLFGLMLLDMRSAIIAIILIYLSNRFLSDKLHLKLTGNLIIIVGILPILLVLSSFLVSNSEYFSFISRNNEDITTGNNRSIIWAFCISELMNFKIIHLIGFGEFGQVGSKVSNLWAKGFSIFGNSEYVSAHNLVLQLILDIGYVGLIIYFTFISYTTRIIRKMYKISGNKNLLIFQNFLFYFAFVGGTEALNCHNAIFWLFIFIMICIIYYTKDLSSNKKTIHKNKIGVN